MNRRLAFVQCVFAWSVLIALAVNSTHAQYIEIWTVHGDDPYESVWSSGSGVATPYRDLSEHLPPGTEISAPDPNYGDTDADGFVEFVSVNPDPETQELVVWNGAQGVEDVIPYGSLSVDPHVTGVLLIDVQSDGIYEILVRWKSSSTDDVGTTLFGTQPVVAPDGSQASVSRLEANVPNPLNPTTTISFVLSTGGDVRLRLYDASGRLVRQLVESRFPAGRHSVPWDGRDDRALRVGSGAYFYELTVDGATVGSKKAIVLK